MPSPRKRTLSSGDLSVKAVDRRTSLPSTIKSATVMTKSKLTARRRSLSSRKVNHHPPAQLYSPPETRSAKKRRMSIGPGAVSGCVLTFSPPDQKENARREKESLEERQRARDKRVCNAKERGQLLVYDINGNAIIGVPTNSTSATPPLPPAALREIIQQQSEKRKQEDDALMEKVVDRLRNTEEVQALKTDKKDLEEKMDGLKEELKAATESLQRLSELEESQEQLKIQTDALQDEKSSMQTQMEDLKTELETATKQLTEQQLKMKELEEAATSAVARKEEREAVISSYKKKVDDLEKIRIPELEIMINTERDNVERLESELETMQNELTSRDSKIQELTNEVAKQNKSTNTDKNEKEEMLKLCDSQATRITELEAEVCTHKRSLQVHEEELSKHSTNLKAEEARFIFDRKKLNDELENASNLLESLVQEKLDLQLKVRTLENALEETSAERDEARSNMQGFDQRENELYRRLHEGERIRREMHGRIMKLMGNIRVFVRVRPQLQHEATNNLTKFSFSNEYDCQSEAKPGEDLTKSFLELKAPYKDRGGLSDRRKTWRYGFDGVFSPKATQQQVWNAVEPLIQCAVDGSAVTLFAYGQTGSGKTYTMLGGNDVSEEGIIGRAVRMMFDQKTQLELDQNTVKVSISVELLEVYNEQVRDLFSDPANQKPLDVNKDGEVANIVQEGNSLENVMAMMSHAQKRRCVKKTASNDVSSRSHLIFTLHFEVLTSTGVERCGKLNICDLAGSERVKKSGVHGQTFEETKKINSSLSTLSNVISSLQEGNQVHQFRDSKLTMLLKHSLEGDSKTMAIVCCSPDEQHFEETKSSLTFAHKASCVELKAASTFSA